MKERHSVLELLDENQVQYRLPKKATRSSPIKQRSQWNAKGIFRPEVG